MLDISDDQIRLAVKRIVVLVRWCEVEQREFPLFRHVCSQVGVPYPVACEIMRELINAGVVIYQPSPDGKRNFRMCL